MSCGVQIVERQVLSVEWGGSFAEYVQSDVERGVQSVKCRLRSVEWGLTGVEG